MAYTVIQKDRTRYVFETNKSTSGGEYYTINTEQLLTCGSSVSRQVVTKEGGNKFFLEMLSKGFKQFRNAREVSWYATTRNNTPFEEEWTTEGRFLVPIKSQVLS